MIFVLCYYSKRKVLILKELGSLEAHSIVIDIISYHIINKELSILCCILTI